MMKINANTKKGQNLIATAKNFEGYTLPEVYGKCSPAKEYAWRNCLFMCQAEHGKNFHICSHNTFSFSVAWETENGTRIETANNSYLVC